MARARAADLPLSLRNSLALSGNEFSELNPIQQRKKIHMTTEEQQTRLSLVLNALEIACGRVAVSGELDKTAAETSALLSVAKKLVKFVDAQVSTTATTSGKAELLTE